MNVEVIALALLNAVRPTAFAAVYALLSSSRPRRSLLAFTLSSFLFSATVGILVVTALHGVRVETGKSTVYSIVALTGGVAALGFAAGMAAGRMPSPAGRMRRERVAPPGERDLIARLRHPSVGLAAGAGVLTHLPGLFYLLGLNAIADLRPGFVGGVVDVLIFVLIWLAIPIASLIFSIRRPEDTRKLLGRIQDWTTAHERPLLIAAFVVVGLYFTSRGIYTLVD